MKSNPKIRYGKTILENSQLKKKIFLGVARGVKLNKCLQLHIVKQSRNPGKASNEKC